MPTGGELENIVGVPVSGNGSVELLPRLSVAYCCCSAVRVPQSSTIHTCLSTCTLRPADDHNYGGEEGCGGGGSKLLQIVLGVHAGTQKISVRNIYTISVNGKHWNQNGAKPRLVSSIFAACVYIKSPLTIMMGKGRCRRLLWLYMYTVVVVHVH